LAFSNALGVTGDVQAAAYYFRLAADQGFSQAQNNYGLALSNGSGVSRDDGAAAHYFKLAADQGFREDQFNFGVVLSTGSGVPRDVQAAATYFKLAETIISLQAVGLVQSREELGADFHSHYHLLE
jgi:TPR repeat protein